jgi:hypothetical protein
MLRLLRPRWLLMLTLPLPFVVRLDMQIAHALYDT